ncbi:MAG: hypothetical protein IMY67_01835 [Bacteroidetes bacterium]|nr:hypothetical protein [Bacteroidota bacterium]
MNTEQILITLATSLIGGLFTFGGIWLRLYYSDKNRNAQVDLKLESNNSAILSKLQETDKKHDEHFKKIDNNFAIIEEKSKHETFAKSFNARLTAESYNYVLGFDNLNEKLTEFLLKGATDAISIFTTIINTEFKHYQKEIISTQFKVARISIASKFSSRSLIVEKNLLETEILKHRNLFLKKFDALMESKKENGERMEIFENLANDMITGIITDVVALNGAVKKTKDE